MEAANACETSVNFYQTTRRNIPDDSHLQDMINAYKKLTGNSSGAKKCIEGNTCSSGSVRPRYSRSAVHSSIQDEERSILRNAVSKESSQ
jgi:hypothetical protein